MLETLQAKLQGLGYFSILNAQNEIEVETSNIYFTITWESNLYAIGGAIGFHPLHGASAEEEWTAKTMAGVLRILKREIKAQEYADVDYPA